MQATAVMVSMRTVSDHCLFICRFKRDVCTARSLYVMETFLMDWNSAEYLCLKCDQHRELKFTGPVSPFDYSLTHSASSLAKNLPIASEAIRRSSGSTTSLFVCFCVFSRGR